MPSFTREQLRTFTTNSANFTAQEYTFTLVNNISTTAGFSMEGARYYSNPGYKYKDIFNSASISDLNNCTLVSGSQNVAFLIDGDSTATFKFTPTATLSKDLILMLAPNVHNVSGSTDQFYGVDLTVSP